MKPAPEVNDGPVVVAAVGLPIVTAFNVVAKEENAEQFNHEGRFVRSKWYHAIVHDVIPVFSSYTSKEYDECFWSRSEVDVSSKSFIALFPLLIDSLWYSLAILDHSEEDDSSVSIEENE